MLKKLLVLLAIAVPVSGGLVAGSLMLLGVGSPLGGGVTPPFNTPTIIPQTSVNFSQSNALGLTLNSALKPNGGTTGSFFVPSTPTQSFSVGAEFQVDSNQGGGLQYLLGATSGLRGLYTTSRNSGPAILGVQSFVNSTDWWTATSAANAMAGISVSNHGTNYNGGLYPFTTPSGCTGNGTGARQPTGWWTPNAAGQADYMDPGMLCGAPPTITPATIPGVGPTQTPSATTCASNTPITGQIQITVTTPIAHGLNPSQTFYLGGYTTTALNGGYLAVAGTSGNTLVGTNASTGICPGSITIGSGTVGTQPAGTGGAAAAMAFGSPMANPFVNNVTTGITTQPGQRVCMFYGELGSETNFPGATYAIAEDHLGNQLPGSPFVNPWLNQGVANATGGTTTGTQSPASPALNITALPTFAISAATYDPTTGYVTFTNATAPYIVGSEFTVSGITSTGGSFNQTYVAVQGTSATSVVGNPLDGPAGVPLANNPGTPTGFSGAIMQSVILPGMVLAGSTPTNSAILPYGTYGSTGTGGIGTYGLTANQTSAITAASNLYIYGGWYGSANASTGVFTPVSQATISDFISVIGAQSAAALSTTLAPGWGGTAANIGMLWGAFPNTNGALTTGALDDVCLKQHDPLTWAANNNAAFGTAWRSHYALNDGGIFGDDSVADLTADISGTSLTVDSVQYPVGGALPTVTASVPLIHISGPGIVGNPTIVSGSAGSYVLSASQPTLTGVVVKAGSFSPAAPLLQNQFTGTIGGTGNQTLTVTSMVPPSGAAFGATVNATLSGTWPNNTALTINSATGTVVDGMCFRDGNVNISDSAPLCINGGTSPNFTVQPNYYTDSSSPLYSGAAMVGSTATIVPGTWLQGAGITTPVQITGYVPGTSPPTIGALGQYTLSNGANGAIGSAQAFNATTVFPGGAIAPGPSLTVSSLRFGTIFPVNNLVANTGALILDGTYDVSLGTPTPIQALVSNFIPSPGVAPTPVTGCTACAWTSLTGSAVAAGKWSGNAISIPAGGPYYVSVRAGNSQNYVIMPNAVFVGHNFAGIGEGNGISQLTNAGGSQFSHTSWVHGFGSTVGWQTGNIGGNQVVSGVAPIFGPPVAGNYNPNFPQSVQGDRFGSFGTTGTNTTLGDAMGAIVNVGGDLLGGPIGIVNFFRDGTSPTIFWTSGNPASATVGVGDGSTLQFSSGAALGGSQGSGAFSYAGIVASVSTAGVVSSVNTGNNPWSFLTQGQKMTCTSGCGTYTSGVLTGPALLSPAPASTITGGVWTITGNVLDFNSALATGATATGSIMTTGGVSSLVVSAIQAGQLAPLQVLSNVPGAPSLGPCTAGCGAFAGGSGVSGTGFPTTSTWALSTPVANFSGQIFLTPPTGTLYQTTEVNPDVIPLSNANFASGVGGGMFIKYGTFQVLDNGTVICTDPTTFSYLGQVGTCVGGNVDSTNTWVNYVTGDYSIVFTAGHAPASGHQLIAQWNNLVSPDSTGGFEQLDWVGDGTSTGGTISAAASRTGGVDGILNGQQGVEGWPQAQLDFLHKLEYTYGNAGLLTKLHNGTAAAPWMFWQGMPRSEGPVDMYGGQGDLGANDYEALSDDAIRESTFNATIGTLSGSGATQIAIMSLTSAASGGIWEGMVLECLPRSLTCALPAGAEVTGLLTGTWGANGSTYQIISNNAFTPMTVQGAPLALHNALAWEAGNTGYVGPQNDLGMRAGAAGIAGASVETAGGMTGALRIGQRESVLIPALMTNTPGLASSPTVLRTIPGTSPCDSAAGYSPCLDDGAGAASYPASHAATWATNVFTITGGLSAGARPFVPGMALSCSGCNTGLVATAVSLPPTPSTATGAGQVGQTFTVTASGTIGGSGSGTLTGGCSGTSGVGSNCIDIFVQLNTTGADALNTCGENDLQGTTSALNAATYLYANGKCTPRGVGALTREFRIGTAPLMDAPNSLNAGSTFDFGGDVGIGKSVVNVQAGYGGIFQNEAFTCNIVAATTIQCVHGPLYEPTTGLFSAIGTWPASGTWVSGGDAYASTGFVGGLIGYPGGQSFAFTPGSGYTNSPTGGWVTGGVCPFLSPSLGSVAPAMGFNVNGGAVTNAYPEAMGNGNVGPCTFPLSFSFTAQSIGASSGGHATMVVQTGSVSVTSITSPVSNVSTMTTSGSPGVPLAIGQTLYNTANSSVLITGGSGTSWTVQNYNTAAIGATTWTNSPIINGALVPGETISGSGIPPATTIFSGPGSGQGGSYVLACASCTALGSRTATSGPTAGSGGSITTPPVGGLNGIGMIADYAMDTNLMGTFLSDNACTSGKPLAAKCQPSAPGTLSMPGMGLMPFGLRRGYQVGG